MMTERAAIRVLTWVTAAFALLATCAGIFYRTAGAAYEYRSIRGETVTIYGRGLYRDMSAEVAPQGIAQDVVTLFLGIPLLLLALRWAGRGSLRGRLLLAGVTAYFFVTYLFYLLMGMYNAMFLAYVILVSASFFALALLLLGFDPATLPRQFSARAPTRTAGVFLVANAGIIGLLWLSVVVPPLLTGDVVPVQVEHYTTLVVQGLDLSLLLPLAAVSGWLLLQHRPLGYLLAPTYLVFLALLMIALVAKLIAMGMLGYSVMPAIVIIPVLGAAAAVLAYRLLRSLEPR